MPDAVGLHAPMVGRSAGRVGAALCVAVPAPARASEAGHMQPATASTTAPARGDEATLFRQHHAELPRAVRHVVNASPELIEDACQVAWVQLLRTQPRRASVFGWLRRVAINEAYRLSRLERREARLDLLPSDRQAEASDESNFDDALRARDALRVVAALPEKQRRDFALHAAGLTYREIAQLTGRTYTNVDKTLDKARAQVRANRCAPSSRPRANGRSKPSVS